MCACVFIYGAIRVLFVCNYSSLPHIQALSVGVLFSVKDPFLCVFRELFLLEMFVWHDRRKQEIWWNWYHIWSMKLVSRVWLVKLQFASLLIKLSIEKRVTIGSLQPPFYDVVQIVTQWSDYIMSWWIVNCWSNWIFSSVFSESDSRLISSCYWMRPIGFWRIVG